MPTWHIKIQIHTERFRIKETILHTMKWHSEKLQIQVKKPRLYLYPFDSSKLFSVMPINTTHPVLISKTKSALIVERYN